ncbi:hypothetical protein L579_3624 [Pantoea sp. AS-PWVM4]|nr:hypothetical protein L579_3624 [Pantoea sp. AS-PWVM4]
MMMVLPGSALPPMTGWLLALSLLVPFAGLPSIVRSVGGLGASVSMFT